MNTSASLRFGRSEGHSNCKWAAASFIFLFLHFHGEGLCPCVPVSSPWLWAAGRLHRSRPWWCRTDLVSAVRPIQSRLGPALSARLSKKMTRRVNKRKWFRPRSVIGIITELWHQQKSTFIVSHCPDALFVICAQLSSHLHHQDEEAQLCPVENQS